MNVLALDTASPAPALALLVDGMAAPLVEPIGAGSIETLVSHLDALLSRAAVERRGLGRVAVVSGPGSFTGLRAGTAFARGLARALGVPLVLVPTFEAASAAFPEPDLADLVLDAGRGEVHRARRRNGALAADASPVVRDRAEAEARAAGASVIDLGAAPPSDATLVAAAALLGREADPLAPTALVYGRVSAAEEKRSRAGGPS